MGRLSRFNLNDLIEKFNVTTFIETGTAYGDGLNFALQSNFTKLYSIEYSKELYDICVNKFNDSRVTLIHGDSKSGLQLIFNNKQIEGNVLYWLDSHFHLAPTIGNTETFNAGAEELRYPLQDELNLIRQYRGDYKDVIIIDDLRIYEDGPYECGNLPSYIKKPLNKLNYEFNNYKVEKDYFNEGYLILTPI